MADTLEYSGTTKYSTVGGGNFKATNVIDMNDVSVANAAAGNDALAATDIIELLAIPAGTVVRNVYITTIRAATGTALTANIGVTGGDVDGFDAAVSLKGTAGTITGGVGGTDANVTANGLVFTSADTIDAVLATVTAVTNYGKIKIVADCFDVTSV